MQVSHALAEVVVGARSDFVFRLTRNESGQSAVGGHGRVVSLPSPIDWLTDVPPRSSGVVADVNKVGELLDGHIVIVKEGLEKTGIPNRVQIREIIFALRTRQAGRFIFEGNRHAVATFVTVVFIVQRLMYVSDEVNDKPQSLAAHGCVPAAFELLNVLVDGINHAAG